MKRILLLIKGLGRGGAEQLLATAAPHLDAGRFAYEVAYLLRDHDALAPALEEAGIATHCLDGGRGLGWLPAFGGLVSERHIDLVHAHSPLAAVGARIGLPKRVPLVYTEHNVWPSYHRATRWANLLTYPRNDHVFAVSEHVRDSIRYPSGLRRRRMPPTETLHHGIDTDRFATEVHHDGVRAELGIPDGAPVIGTVANFKPQKGYGFLLRAARRVRERYPQARFVLVGDGPLRPRIRAEARRLGLADAVIFTGSRSDVPRLVSAFDVFVLPSLFEGLAIALIEAMALGRSSVVTSAGGLPEVVEDGRQGFVVPPGNAEALAEKISTLVSDPGTRARFGAEAQLRARAFDIRRAVRRIEEVYSEVLA